MNTIGNSFTKKAELYKKASIDRVILEKLYFLYIFKKRKNKMESKNMAKPSIWPEPLISRITNGCQAYKIL